VSGGVAGTKVRNSAFGDSGEGKNDGDGELDGDARHRGDGVTNTGDGGA